MHCSIVSWIGFLCQSLPPQFNNCKQVLSLNPLWGFFPSHQYTQNNKSQHNNTQHKGLVFNTQQVLITSYAQHNYVMHYADCRNAVCHYAECRGALSNRRIFALTASIWLGWKWLTATNTLTYYETELTRWVVHWYVSAKVSSGLNHKFKSL